MDGMIASLHPKHQKKERILCLLSQSGFQKEKLWQLSVPPLLVTKNSKTRLSTIRGRSKGTERYTQALAGTLHG